MNVVCFYENVIPRRLISNESDKLVELWETSWAQWGWNPIIVGLKEAKQHPMYDIFNDTSSPLYTYSINNPRHLRLCYLRWLAYHSYGCTTWADLDVMNYGVTPDMMPKLSNLPICFSKSGCCGHSNKEGYTKIINNLARFIDEKTMQAFMEKNENTSDMMISARTRPEFFPPEYKNNLENKLSCVDFYREGNYLLVHYHGGLYRIKHLMEVAPDCIDRLKVIQELIKDLGKQPSRAKMIQAIRPVQNI